MQKSCPQRLADKYGNPSEAARKLVVDRQTVYTWVNQGYIPSRHALDVEALTQGEITIREILEEEKAKNPVKIKARKVE
jgi:predicted site-specific integrase-resolvase